MSLLAGVLIGAAIAMLEVVAMHLHIAIGPFPVAENAVAVPFVLVPLALLWGWTWVSERWAKRARARLALYTIGLYVAMSLVGPFDMLIFWPTMDLVALGARAPVLALATLVFVLPATLAAIVSLAFGSGRVPMNAFTLAIAYAGGAAAALVSPLLAVGTVTGTAAGHAWRSPSSRSSIAMLVLALMLGAAFVLPYALVAAGVASGPPRALLP